MPRITYNDIINMSDDALQSVEASPEGRELLRQFREKFEFRSRAFKRAGKNVYSPALEKLNTFFEKKGKPAIESMNQRQIESELFHIRDFFRADTGTVKGARKVMRDQDIMIFGATDKGNPRYRMTREERDRFWSVYEEYVRAFPTRGMESTKVQQALGELVIKDRKEDETPGALKKGEIGLMTRLNELDKRVREKQGYATGGFNVFSGRRATK